MKYFIFYLLFFSVLFLGCKKEESPTNSTETLPEGTIFIDGFENGFQNWTVDKYCYIKTDTVYEGSKSANFHGSNITSSTNDISTIILNKSFDLSSTTTAFLRFWYRSGLGSDYLNPLEFTIYISIDNGSTWSVIDHSSLLDNSWERYEKNISSYTGPGSKNVKIKITLRLYLFTGTVNINFFNSYIDYVAITKQ